ncbi:MAG: hypothetical protein IKL73_07370 [Lachnospiraceae bacterium]|nr:hypothetical protein [Lachnospiraceae bacterium]
MPKRCTIGKNVVFEHNALGVTIYPDSIIEDNVHIQHHVTIGLRTHNSGSPIIRKGAFIGAHTLILGNVEIGEGAIIGAGSLVLDNVPANTIYYNVREKTIRKK